jgi:hypothetical protein
MGQAWTRENWNNIIQQVNNLAQNPDPGCAPLAALTEVSPNHIWTKSDITNVRNKLMQICNDNTFIAELRLWTQQIIDEINTAIEAGWCDCALCQAEDETYVIFDYEQSCTVRLEPWDCNEDDPCVIAEGSYFDYYSAAAGVTGFGPGIGGGYSIWRVERKDGVAEQAVSVYNNTFDCAGAQTQPMPDPEYIEGHLTNSVYGPIDHCFHCTLYTWSCWLMWCSCAPCVTGIYACCDPPPAPEAYPCECDPDGTYGDRNPAYPAAEEDCTHSHHITFEVRKTCYSMFHGAGAPCRKCCTDGIHFCDLLQCPGDPACT